MPAQRKINLLPKNNFEDSFLGKLINWAVNVGRWIVVLTEFVVICAFLSRFYFDTELANLFDNISQNKTIVNSASEFEETFLYTQKKIKIVKSLLLNLSKPSVAFAEINKTIPRDMTLTSVNFNDGKIEITGYCLSLESLNFFVKQLKNQSNFSQINLSSVSRKENTAGINFNIIFTSKNESVPKNSQT